MTEAERNKKAIEQKLGELAREIDGIWQKALDEDRPTTEDERNSVDERVKTVDTLKAKLKEAEAEIEVEKDVRAIGRQFGKKDDGALEFRDSVTLGNPVKALSIGEMFVESEQFKSMQTAGFSGRWSTGLIDMGVKGTLLEGSSSPGSGTGGGFLPTPDVVPGVTQKLFQRLSVMDLLPQGTTTGNTVRYVVEGTATSGAAGVAEGGDKPQSTLALSTKDEPVKKIATSLIVSDEMLEDAAQVASYINSRLALFVEIEQERQLVRGAGTNELYGIMDSSRAINIYAGGTAAGNKAVQLFKALSTTRGSSFLEPDALIMHPTDWQDVRLLTDTAGQFFGGGPFQGPYGNGQNLQISSQVQGPVDYLWGKPVVVTTALGGAGTALLGAFSQAAQVWNKQGVTVEATNSHDDLFLKNLVAIRAEKRLGLSVYRPTAFTEVRLA